ncbi:hypothetical protein PIB30_047993 [Stylosanthes scabra]|uniref:Uncharacterized protein n=1 Tax=Stylosanthes scabra TaxID=79078 RepID=A0ABU6TGQ8_9FABA|nr:hypothetical protein [Stylosanthes scabra]
MRQVVEYSSIPKRVGYSGPVLYGKVGVNCSTCRRRQISTLIRPLAEPPKDDCSIQHGNKHPGSITYLHQRVGLEGSESCWALMCLRRGHAGSMPQCGFGVVWASFSRWTHAIAWSRRGVGLAWPRLGVVSGESPCLGVMVARSWRGMWPGSRLAHAVA